MVFRCGERLNNLRKPILEALCTILRMHLNIIHNEQQADEELENELCSQFEPRGRLGAKVVFVLLILHF